MVDFESILSMLIAQAPLVAVTILAIILYMERRFFSIERRFFHIERSIEERFLGVENRISNLERRIAGIERGMGALIEYNESLLSIQVSRGAVSDTEYRALASLLSLARVVPSSKYYTKRGL